MRILVAGCVLLLFGALITVQAECRYWVFFRDRNIAAQDMPRALDNARRSLTSHALARRLKSMPDLVDESDLAVAMDYVDQVRATGVRLRVVSRYLNAVSVDANEGQVNRLRALPFVRSVEPFHSRREDARLEGVRQRSTLDDLSYGPSLRQNQMCRVPELHSRGLSGQGVLLCFLDSGFRLTHPVFDSLRVPAARDFIFNDANVANEPDQDSSDQDTHGTAVLSVAAGYRDGWLVGPAYGADFMLAKTEWVPTETPSEEDRYVAALEWADSAGADIVSSSLGYTDWYTFADLNGHTAVSTMGVVTATRHGILCVVSAGNYRLQPWGHISAPADADSILAVGSVDTLGTVSVFSSPGPTADGRIKPEVCALGEYVWVAVPPSDYATPAGTSFAAPMVAGVAALVMEAHPDWSAQQVRTAIMQTASRASVPDNDYGWGIVDGVAAVDYPFNSVFPSSPRALPECLSLACYPNPVNGTASITLDLPRAMAGRLALYDLLGREVRTWNEPIWPAGEQSVTLDATSLPSGLFFARFASPISAVWARVLILK
jgi:serine protease AprX